MDVSGLHVKKAIVFQAPSLSDLGLGGPALLVADGDDLAINQFAGLLQGCGGSDSGNLLHKVQGNVAQLLLDFIDNLFLCCSGEGVAPHGEDITR